MRIKIMPWILAVLCIAGAGRAAESAMTPEAERQQAAAEEEAARKVNSEAIYSDYSGKVTLFTPDQKADYADSGAIGLFASDKPDKAVYLIKVESEKTAADLKTFDGKNCTVSAKIRNEGKYIVVKKVELNGAEYNFKRRRGGMGM